MTVNYYDYNTIIVLDSWNVDTSSPYHGFCDIHGNGIVWDSGGDILLYDGSDTINISENVNPDSVDDNPTISYGQVAWEANQGAQWDIYLYDGSTARKITEDSEWDYWAFIDNGRVVWTKDLSPGDDQLCYFDGQNTQVLDTNNKFPPYWYSMVNNKRVAWLKKFKSLGGFSYVLPRLYNDTVVIDLVESLDTTYSAGENHWLDNGFVVWAGYDGQDYEIYLYVGDTTFSPPGPFCGLVAESTSTDGVAVKLTWRKSVEPDVAGYKIYRSKTSYQYKETDLYKTISNPNDTTYTDSSPRIGKNYYVGKAFDDQGHESGFSNQASFSLQHLDSIPPKAPSIVVVDTSNTDVDLIWNKVTEDTLSNTEHMDYYVVYRDTSPAYVPASSDSIGYTSYDDTTYADSGAVDSTNDFYYLIKAVDEAENYSDPSNQGFKFRQVLNENPDEIMPVPDKNWISIPYICPYDSASDLFDAIGTANCDTITRLDPQTQQYTHCYFEDPNYVNNFALEAGQMYEVDVNVDTTVIILGAHDPDLSVFLNENSGELTDKNWISLPYNAVYDSASDLMDSIGYNCYSITRLDPESQQYTTRIRDPFGFGLSNFPIERGAGYEIVPFKDTTWLPDVSSNKGGFFFTVARRADRGTHSGKAEKELPRITAPEWDIEEGMPIDSAAISREMIDHKKRSKQTAESRGGFWINRRRLPHVCFGKIPNPEGKELHFKAYITAKPWEVLTEKTAGCAILNDGRSTFWMVEAGNYYTPWQHRNKMLVLFAAESLDPSTNTVYLVPYGYVVGILDARENHQRFDRFYPRGSFQNSPELIGYS
ncbi:MAG TPA: hypothetical protein EYP58_01330 [bacterium (Candidatus Stahlbacteria)]|nr:hypothetical protein [Candidatus Stahlbacteria bacterium]